MIALDYYLRIRAWTACVMALDIIMNVQRTRRMYEMFVLMDCVILSVRVLLCSEAQMYIHAFVPRQQHLYDVIHVSLSSNNLFSWFLLCIYTLLFPTMHDFISYFHVSLHHLQDIIISTVLVVVFIAAGLTQAVYADKLINPPDTCNPCSDYAWGHITMGAAVSNHASSIAYK